MLVPEKSLDLDFNRLPWFLKVTSEPTLEPVTVDEFKMHDHLTANFEDAKLEGFVKAARTFVESDCKRRFMTQTVKLYMDRFPDWEIELHCSPVASVTSVTYVDTSGVTQTVSTSDYQTDLITEPGIIAPTFGDVWPVAKYRTKNAVTVEMVCGYSSAALVPPVAKQAICVLAAHWYLHREAVVSTGAQPKQLPLNYEDCIKRLRYM